MESLSSQSLPYLSWSGLLFEQKSQTKILTYFIEIHTARKPENSEIGRRH